MKLRSKNVQKKIGAFRVFSFSAGLTLSLWAILLSPVVPLWAADSNSETAGAEQARFEKEAALEDQARPSPEKIESAKPALEETRPSPEESMSSDVFFTLRDIEISGNEHIPADTLKKQVSERFQTEINLKGLQEIASKIKQYYRDEGYIAAYVYLPPQGVENGVVKIAVVEGKLGQVEITGNRWYSTKVLKRTLRLSADHVVFYRDLRSALAFLNKHNDIKVKSVLKPGVEAETTDIEINVSDKFPIHLSTDVNNLGTDNTGNARWGVTLAHNNLLGLMDQLVGRFQIGTGAWAVGTDYSIPITSYHTLLQLSYSYAAVDVGGPFKALDVEGHATTYGVNILQPILYGGPIELSYNLGFDWKSIRNKTLGAYSGKDEHRILKTGFNLESSDRFGRTLSPHSFHFGFSDFMGSSPKSSAGSSRALAGSQFFIYRGALIRYLRLPFGLMVASRNVFQLTPDRLAPSEQLRLGGAFSVRGYPEGEYLADYGGFLANEILIPAFIFPKNWKLPFSKETLRKQIQGVGFFDYGFGLARDPLAGEDRSRQLAGLGGGVRAHLFDRVYGRFHWAAPVGASSSDGDRSQFYFGVSAEML